MRFTQPFKSAVLIKRYKRFLADVELADKSRLTVHCPNSGSMLGCNRPGSEVIISKSANPRRKYAYTLEMIKVDETWVGLNTGLTNRLVREALEVGVIREIGPIDRIKAEVKTSQHTRLDFCLTRGDNKIFVEVKNCSLAENNIAMFPDAVTVRGTKHLNELMGLRHEGHGAAVLFCVQREDAESFASAAHIDPLYAETLARAQRQGVMVLACQAKVSPAGIEIFRSLPVIL